MKGIGWFSFWAAHRLFIEYQKVDETIFKCIWNMSLFLKVKKYKWLKRLKFEFW